MFVCRTMFDCMHFVWNYVWFMGSVPILASGCVWNYFCSGASSRRRQQKPEENFVAGWRQACRAVVHGAAMCAWRGNVCLLRHTPWSGSPGQHLYQRCQPSPGLSRHPRWHGKVTLTRQAQWRGRTALPRLSFITTSTVARTPRP
jgi:hypothetical protein